jgi:hypothetical protein
MLWAATVAAYIQGLYSTIQVLGEVTVHGETAGNGNRPLQLIDFR